MIKFKLYFDKDAETEWLNAMASEGYAMSGFFAGFYKFVKCEPGEYIYQVDINGGLFKVSKDYRNFMEEMGIEIVALWGFWVILRKKATDGEFQLYTDHESKIACYTKIRNMFKVVTIIELLLFYVEIFAASKGVLVGWIGMAVIGVALLSCARMAIKTNQIIMELKYEEMTEPERKKRQVSGLLLSGLLLNSCALVLQESVSVYLKCGIQGFAIALMLAGLYRMANESCRGR